MDIKTITIDIFALELIFSFKKKYPRKILIIGIIKYPKLASITRFVATAKIQTAQLVKIRKPEKKETSGPAV